MANVFDHPSLNLLTKKTIVYTAFSKRNFYMRMIISSYVLKEGKVPLNPFMCFDYFLADLARRDVVRNANNNLVRISDEIWVFGEISNGVLAEIHQAKQTGKPVKYFTIENDKDIEGIPKDKVVFEKEISPFISLQE